MSKPDLTPLAKRKLSAARAAIKEGSRRVVERRMTAKEPLSLIYAVPDHPWMKSADKAAVRIAMTVAQAGSHEGVLAEVVSEAELNSDTPKVELERREGKVTSHLTLGANLSLLRALIGNTDIAIKGFELGTQALLISPAFAEQLKQSCADAARYVHPYMNGNDLKNGRVWRYVIDTYPALWPDIEKCAELAQYLLTTVRGTRNPNADDHVLRNWWQFRRTGESIRSAVADTKRYLATVRTAKHRYFIFLPNSLRAESKTVIVAIDSAAAMACLSSRLHVLFANETGGWQVSGTIRSTNILKLSILFPFHLRQRLASLNWANGSTPSTRSVWRPMNS